MLLVAPASPTSQRDEDAIATIRGQLGRARAALAAIDRQPPVLALAPGGDVTAVAHRRILADALRREVARQEDRLARELAAEWRLDGTAARLPETMDDDARPDPARTARLATLAGSIAAPPIAPVGSRLRTAPLYRMPARGRLVVGTGERSDGGGAARGLTFATRPGLPVVAPGAGRVRYAGPFGVYGDIVILDHGRGWTTLIAGLDRASVSVGDDLFSGAAIGRTTRRLLVELRHRGRVTDIVGVAAALDP